MAKIDDIVVKIGRPNHVLDLTSEQFAVPWEELAEMQEAIRELARPTPLTVSTVGQPVPSGTRWWGVEHSCGGVERSYPTLHWADEPEQGAGPRRAFECDACGDRYAFYREREP